MPHLMRKAFHSIVSDHSASYAALWIIFIYILISGYLRFENIFYVPLSLATLSVLIPIFFTDILKVCVESLSHKESFTAKEDLSTVSVIIPTKNGERTIQATVSSLLRKFAPEKIFVVSNGSLDTTCQKARALGVNVLDLEESIGKVRAINEALHLVKTPYTLILDDDTLVGDAVIPTNLLSQGYRGIAFRVLPIRIPGKPLTVLQTHEYRKSMDIARSFHNATATVQTISGAIGLFHTTELIRQIEVHSGEFSGEDLQRTLHILASFPKKGVVMADSTVYTHVPQTIPDLFNQRIFGWNPGFFANLGIYITLLVGKRTPLRLRYEAFYNIFVIICMDPLRIISLPVLLFSPVFLVIFYCIYVLLDLVPYLAMGRKEPLWVVFASPLYGLFNSFSRFVSLATFLYRRLSVHMSTVTFYDDYHLASFFPKLTSLVMTLCTFAAPFIVYTYILMVPTLITTALISPVPPNSGTETITVHPAQSVQPLENSSIQSAPQTYPGFRIQAQAGDSNWTLAGKAIDDYMSFTKQPLSARQKNSAIGWLIIARGRPSVSVGQTVTFSTTLLEDAYHYTQR